MASPATPSWPDSLPPDVGERLDAALDGLPTHRCATFRLRVRRWWEDLVGSLAIYPKPSMVAGRVLELGAAAYARREDQLHLLDERRLLEPDWFQRPGQVGYAAYTERLAPPGAGLAGVAERVGHLRDLGVTYLHLMPLLQPRPAPNDGGYAVADYRTVRPDLGTMEDLQQLTGTLREHQISLCLDLVLNHVAREHEWAQRARAGEARYRDYFLVYDDRQLPDAYERTLPEVFPDFAPGSFTWDEDLHGWVWTTFNAWQWDLNWANPDVFAEMADAILFLANQGVEVLRLDAIAFTWKRRGTSCQNQPEVHQLTRALRALARIVAPALIFKAEAIVGPNDLVSYLGRGAHYGKVSDLAYHNSLMVQIWSMLAARDSRLAVHALSRIPSIPSSTGWITYLRCHDDIGWAVDDRDAASVLADGHGHREFLSRFYSGDFDGSFAEGLVFQHNPATGDRRISGTAASLLGLGRGLLARDPALVDDAVARILLAHAVVLGWGGIPVIWSGDEIATLNDPHWDEVPEHAQDNRWAHRPALDWDVVQRARAGADPGDPATRVLAGLRHLTHVRRGLPHLHAAVPTHPVATPDAGLFAVVREHPVGPVVEVYNITAQERQLPGWWLRDRGLDPHAATDAISDRAPRLVDDDALVLAPYQPWWLVATDPESARSAS